MMTEKEKLLRLHTAWHMGELQSTWQTLALGSLGENDGHSSGQVCFFRKQGLFLLGHTLDSRAA